MFTNQQSVQNNTYWHILTYKFLNPTCIFIFWNFVSNVPGNSWCRICQKIHCNLFCRRGDNIIFCWTWIKQILASCILIATKCSLRGTFGNLNTKHLPLNIKWTMCQWCTYEFRFLTELIKKFGNECGPQCDWLKNSFFLYVWSNRATVAQ